MAGVEGRVALVTGAGNPDGIGFATACLLAKAGASVVVAATTDRVIQRADELPTTPDKALAWKGDLTLPGEAQKMIDAIVGHFGHLDIVVNNAGMAQTGVSRAWSAVEDIDETEWRSALGLSLDT